MQSIARNAWLQAGVPETTPASTIDTQCGSAQQAVNLAAALIASGTNDIAIGAGVEHMGHVPPGAGVDYTGALGTPWPEELVQRYRARSPRDRC